MRKIVFLNYESSKATLVESSDKNMQLKIKYVGIFFFFFLQKKSTLTNSAIAAHSLRELSKNILMMMTNQH